VLDEGKILDVGRHEELMVRDPMYKRMVALQFGHQGAEPVDLAVSS
jgi:ABC-type multidrug transport system fused ATPase/permease subunit